jgi:PAS domain S-box-containing protein
MALCLAWTLLYGFEMSAETLALKTSLVRFRLMPSPFLGVVSLALAAGMAGDRKLLTRRNVLLLSVLPTFEALMCLTIGHWPYMLDDLAVEQIGDLQVLTYRNGPIFYLQLLYNYLLISAAIILIYGSTRHAKGIYRAQGGVLAGALLFPLLVNVAYQFEITPIEGFNFTSASFTVGCVFILWGLKSLRLLDIRPTARDVVMEEIPDIVLAFDDQCRLIDFNRAAATQLGLEGTRAFGRNVADVLGVTPGFADRCHSEKAFHEELTLAIGSGNRVFEASVREVPSPQGPLGRVIILRDITEREEADELLRESERRYREMIEMAPFPVAITRKSDGRIRLINRMCQDQFRIPREEALTRMATEFYADPDDRERLASVLKKTGVIHGYEMQLKTSDGEKFWAYLSTAVMDFEGEEAYFVAFNDINERRKATDALRVANVKLNLLATITRHDLLNKLTTIKGYADLSAEGKGRLKADEYLEKLSLEATAAESIISFTRDYQDLGSLDPIWQEAGALLESAATPLDLGEVRLSNGLRGVEVLGDALLQKVFYNLLENALRHGQRLTRIETTCEERGADLAIIFQDDGVGVSDAEKERIFERGFGKNTGLGLYLAREILSITGITIRECGREGHGARFEITVPNGAHRPAQRP